MINKLISSLLISVFTIKHLSQAFTMIVLGFKLPYVLVVALLAVVFNIKSIFSKLYITKKQLYIFMMVTIFYILIINNLNYDNELFVEKSNNLYRQGLIYLYLPFLVLFIKELPDEEYYKNFIKIFIIFFLLYAGYKVFLFHEEYPLNSIWTFSNFHNYFSFYKTPVEIIQTDALRTESIRSGRLVGIFLVYIILLTNFKKFFKVILFITLLLLMILIGNRGSLLASLIILLIFINKRYIIFLFIFCLYFLLITSLDSSIFTFFNNTILSGKFQSFESSERIIIWLTGLYNIDIIGLLGNGIGGFYELTVPEIGHASYPHNIGLEIFYEFGYIAFFIYLLTVYLLIKKAFVYYKLIFVEKFLYVSSVYYLLVAQLSGNIYMNIHTFSFIIMFFLIHYNKGRHINE